MTEQRSRRARRLRLAGLSASAAVVLAGAGAVALVPPTWLGEVAPQVAGRTSRAGLDAPVLTLDPVTVRGACAAAPAATMGEAAVVDPAAPPQATAPLVSRSVVTFPRADSPAAPARLDQVVLEPRGELRLAGGGARTSAALVAEPGRQRSAAPAGATVAVTPAGDLRGLVAQPCVLTQDVTWLIGGGTQVGESTAVYLRNVGDTPAVVSVRAWGTLGELAAPTLSRVTLAAGEQQEFLLEGAIAPDPGLALQAEVSGGAVATWAQSLRLDGLVSAGISAVPHVAAPATTLLVPGVVGTAADPSVLRLVNPGSSEARVQPFSVDAEGARTALEPVDIDPGTVVELPLPDDATRAVAIEADVPVTAAVALRRTGLPSLLDPETPPVDIAWAPALEPRTAWAWALPRPRTEGHPADLLRASLQVAGPEALGGSATLTVYRGADAAAGITELEVRPGAPLSVDLPGDAVAVQLTSDVPLAASVLLSEEGEDGQYVEVLPGTPDPHADQALRVELD